VSHKGEKKNTKFFLFDIFLKIIGKDLVFDLLKILPRISVTRIKNPAKDFCSKIRFACGVCIRPSVLVVNGSLDLAARAIFLQTFLFHLLIQGAATEFSCVGQIHRTRDVRVLERRRVA
jgi:hypothetical protein